MVADGEYDIDAGFDQRGHDARAAVKHQRFDAGRGLAQLGERRFERRDGDIGGEDVVAHAVEHCVVVIERGEHVVGAAHGDQLAGDEHSRGVERRRGGGLGTQPAVQTQR